MVNKLRKYQIECVKACRTNNLGRIVLPTASGKTTIAMEVMADRIKSGKGESKVFAVFVPRILLGKQWIKKTAEVLLKQHKLKVNFVNINTGGISTVIRRDIEKCLFDLGFPVKPVVTAINPDVIRSAVEFFQKDNSSVIVICTYHSCQALLAANLNVDTMFADECHFIVSDNEFFQCTNLVAKNKYYMTATPRFTDSDEGKGMNNESVYGPIIYEKKPREMIEVGAIVGPKLHVVATDVDANENNYNAMMTLVYDTFLKHKETVKKHSCKPDHLGAKLLVICDGQMTLEGLLSSRVFREIHADQPNLKFFGLCTAYGLMIDGHRNNPPVSNSRKEEFLLALDRLDPNADALIFHVDMIGEGLDVPAITGILMLRNCGKIKFLQNEGRAGRPQYDDMCGIRDGTLKVGDYANYVKPHCYVILPYCLANKDDFVERMVRLVRSLRSDFDFDPSEDIITDLLHAAQVGPDFKEDELEREIRSRVLGMFEQISHTIENEDMDDDELILLTKMGQLDDHEKLLFIRRIGMYMDRAKKSIAVA